MSPPTATIEIRPATRPAASRRERLPLRLAWVAIVVLAGWNAWHAWEWRTLPDIKEVNRLIVRGRHAEAEPILVAMTRRSPHDGHARALLARVLAAQGKTRECAEQLRAVPPWWPSKADALYREGQAWMSIDRAKDAERAFREYIADDPNHPVAKPFEGEAETELINLCTLEDRWDEARAVVWKSYDRIDDLAGKRNLAIMALRTRIERSAPLASLPRVRRFVATDPTDSVARLAIAHFAHEAGLKSEADDEIARCVAERPEDPEVWRVRMAILVGKGDETALTPLLMSPPASLAKVAAYWELRGLRAFNAGRWVEAEASYRRAHAIDPSMPESVYRLGFSLARLGRRSEAVALQKQHASMEKASARLTIAFNAYLDATSANPPPGTPSATETARNLARICQTLSWPREAESWAMLAGSAP